MRKHQRIIVKAVLRRDPDVKLYAQALIELAREKEQRRTEGGTLDQEVSS